MGKVEIHRKYGQRKSDQRLRGSELDYLLQPRPVSWYITPQVDRALRAPRW